jgi:hypothetical protein
LHVGIAVGLIARGFCFPGTVDLIASGT